MKPTHLSRSCAPVAIGTHQPPPPPPPELPPPPPPPPPPEPPELGLGTDAANATDRRTKRRATAGASESSAIAEARPRVAAARGAAARAVGAFR